MLTEDGETINYDEEVQRIAEMVFDQDDVPQGAIIQVLQPSQKTQAGWAMVLIRHPLEQAPKQ